MKIKFILISLLIITTVEAVEAQSLKGKLSVKGKSLNPADFSIVAQNTAATVRSASIATNGSFTISGASSSDRLSLLYKSNYYSPVVLGIKRGKSVKLYASAAKKGCSAGTDRAILTAKKKLNGSLKIEVNPEAGIAYAKKLSEDELKKLAKGITSDTASNCVPAGLVSGASLGTRQIAAAPDDTDGDGQTNTGDLDDDDDGVSDAFDGDNDNDGIVDDADPDNNDRNATSQLFYFQQLHLNREASYHPKLQAVAREVIDNALRTSGGLALEVKSGNSVELNCGGDESTGGKGLPWCTEGGTGRSREPYPDGVKFPEQSDADGDGKGEINAGGTGDFQLLPGASSGEILPGDTFIEEVTTAELTLTKYVGVLNSVVISVPGIVEVIAGGTTNTFDYPPTTNSIGTYENPIIVPSTGDVLVTFTLYPPVYNTAEGEKIPGVMTIGLQIPNGPCTYDPVSKNCSGSGSGPGLLPGALFSNPSSGWTVANDGIRSNAADQTVADSQPVTFTVNLTGNAGVTGWDAGEFLRVPVQAFDNNGTTAAHNVILKR